MKNGKPLIWVLDNEWTDHSKEEEIFEKNGFAMKVTISKTLQQDMPLYAPHADGVIAQIGFPCDAAIISELGSCKVIGVYGVGFNHVDWQAAEQKGIPVCNVPDYCVEEVSDHTIALMLAVTRRLSSYRDQVKAGHWDALDTLPIPRIRDMTIGLLGFGRIARLVAAKLRPFGARLLAHDKYAPSKIFAEYGVASVSLEELLRQSNLLSLHVPLSAETDNLIHYERMKTMPKGAFIINTCRGGVVNEDDLHALIEEGHLGGAGLDVLKQEPPRPDDPLLHTAEVLITPHSSYISEGSVTELRIRTCQIMLDGVNGRPLANVVNGVIQTVAGNG